MSDKKLRASWLLALACITSSCANSGKHVDDSSDPSSKIGVSDADVQIQNTLSGSIHVTLQDKKLLSEVEAYLIDKSEQRFRLQRATNNSGERYLKLSGLKIGSYDLIVKHIDSKNGGYDNAVEAVRLNGIEIRSSDPHTITELELYPTYTVRGEIRARDGNGLSATLQIPGTGIEAISGTDGTYELHNVPVGKHRIKVNAKSYHTGIIENIHLKENADTDPSFSNEPLYLLSSENEEGIHSLSKSAFSRYLSMTFIAVSPPGMNRMRISESPDFGDASWQPLRSSFTYAFKDSGSRTLFVQFSQNGTAVSEIFRRDVDIDLQDL